MIVFETWRAKSWWILEHWHNRHQLWVTFFHTDFCSKGHNYPWHDFAWLVSLQFKINIHTSSVFFLPYLLNIWRFLSLICLGWPPDADHWFLLRNWVQPIRNAYFFWQNGTHDALLPLTELTNHTAFATGRILKGQVTESKLFFPFGEHLGAIFPYVRSVSSCLTHTKTPGHQIHPLTCHIPSVHQQYTGSLNRGGPKVECLPEKISPFILFCWTMIIREIWSANSIIFLSVW